MKLRPLHDHVVVQVEPAPEKTRSGIIITQNVAPVRLGKVLAIGPGRQYPNKFVPTVLKAGERIAFFKAVTETKQGTQLGYVLEDDQVILRETDALFVVAPEAKIEVGQ